MTPQEVRVITRLAICGAFSGRYVNAHNRPGDHDGGGGSGSGSQTGQGRQASYDSVQTKADRAVAKAEQEVQQVRQELDQALTKEITQDPQIVAMREKLKELDSKRAEIERKHQERKAAIDKKYADKKAAAEERFARVMKEAGL